MAEAKRTHVGVNKICMKTYHIHISGIVQGVGFRPYVHRLALDMNIKGWVSNGANGVHILCKGTQEGIEQFYAQIIQHPPAQAYIAAHSCIVSEEACPNNFHIRQSEEGGSVQMMLTPDMTLCDDCKKELNDPNNKRFHYPFITCVNCGPRYSITTKLPYSIAKRIIEVRVDENGNIEGWLNERNLILKPLTKSYGNRYAG